MIYYKLYVRSIIDYCSVLYPFALKLSMSSLERIQPNKNFTRILKIRQAPSYEIRLNRLSLETRSTRFKRTDLLTLFKLIKGSLTVPSFHFRFSEHNHFRILIPSIRTSLYKKNYFTIEVLPNGTLQSKAFHHQSRNSKLYSII